MVRIRLTEGLTVAACPVLSFNFAGANDIDSGLRGQTGHLSGNDRFCTVWPGKNVKPECF